MISVLIADDHKIFREGIVAILQAEPGIDVAGEARDGRELLQRLEQVQPNVLLLDISMGETNTIDIARFIKGHYPSIQILVLSMHSDSSYVIKMLEAGASGYLLKDAGSSEMLNAIRTVAEGNTYYSSQVSSILIDHLTKGKKVKTAKKDVPLTEREIEILKLIAQEYSNPEIAEQLYISIRTVDTHRRNILEKLGLKNTAGLVKYAMKHGLLDE